MILGVDPGNKGALALFCPETHAVELFDMPVKRAARGKYAQDVDGYELAILVDSLKRRIARAVVEQVQSRPRQAGQFSFGTNYGRVLGVIESNLIPLTLVPSSKWKPAMGLRGADKAKSIALASTMFPSVADQLARAKDDGRAEALLIAYYGANSVQLK
jgi:crossover junction endodeoxyribonuclease RuvC